MKIAVFNNRNSVTHDKKILFILILTVIVFSLLALISNPIPTHAETVNQPVDYELLAPLPLGGSGSEPTSTTDPLSYVKGIFILLIAGAGTLAVVMIVWGGIKYMSTDAFEGKASGRETVENAVWGLLLAISAYLLLYTINPTLVEFNLDIDSTEEIQNSDSTNTQ